MQVNRCLVTISLVILTIGFSVGCGKDELAGSQPPQTSVLSGNWQAVTSGKFAGLTVSDAGACFLDAVNGATGDGPFLVKSGSRVSLAGWAVDLKAGRLGTNLGIQLNSASSYFISADSYSRPGLGAALKSSPALDGGGLKLDATPLNVPAGDYRVLFLIQSDAALLRCDTGRTLRVQ